MASVGVVPFLDDIAIVPNGARADPKDVSVSWQIDAYKFDMPVIAAPMDSAMSPETVIALAGLAASASSTWKAVDPVRGPQPVLDQIAALENETNSPAVTRRMQELYQARSSPN